MDSAIDLAGTPSGVFHVGVRPVPAAGVTERLSSMMAELADIDGVRASDADRVDQLGLLERLKAGAAAAQARVTVEFEASQLAVQQARGVRARDRGRGIGDQVALARGSGGSQGGRHLGFAQALVNEMPHTHALLTAGEVSEWVATILVRETAVLTVEDRRAVDERLCAMSVDTATGRLHPPFVLGLSAWRITRAASALAAQLDPQAVARRAAKAAKHRKVTTRPAPDTMVWLSALLPVKTGVACWAGLDRAARSLKAQGDERSLDQIRADLLVQRVTGQATADAVSTEICLVMTDQTLTGRTGGTGGTGSTGGSAADRPARTADGTVVPAEVAR